MSVEFVADVVISENYIYYSTEHTNDTICRIDTQTGETIYLPGYYPNVSLYLTKENAEDVCFTYNNQNYIIKDDSVILLSDEYEVLPKKRLKEYVIQWN